MSDDFNQAVAEELAIKINQYLFDKATATGQEATVVTSFADFSSDAKKLYRNKFTVQSKKKAMELREIRKKQVGIDKYNLDFRDRFFDPTVVLGGISTDISLELPGFPKVTCIDPKISPVDISDLANVFNKSEQNKYSFQNKMDQLNCSVTVSRSHYKYSLTVRKLALEILKIGTDKGLWNPEVEYFIEPRKEYIEGKLVLREDNLYWTPKKDLLFNSQMADIKTTVLDRMKASNFPFFLTDTIKKQLPREWLRYTKEEKILQRGY